MTDFLVRHFVKNHQDIRDAGVRERYGKLCSLTGMTVNVFLFAIKLAAGTLSGSVSITADAFNNLSDAASSVVSLIGFKWSNKPADREHPFGHARIEYIVSSVVAVFILLMAAELLKTALEKISNPSPVLFGWPAAGILAFSIAAKLWLFLFNRNLGKRVNSPLMLATAADSLSDVMATSAVLLSSAVSPLIGFELDGYMGVAVAAFIAVSGIKILKQTIDSILGQAPPHELVETIERYIKNYDGVMGLHDLVTHEYGPNRCFASVHVEVDADVDILISHDLVDNIERDIKGDYGIHLVIHMDPIVMNDPFVVRLRQLTEQVVYCVDDTLTMHDFRVVRGATQSKLIFDVVVPYHCKKSEGKVVSEICERIRGEDHNLSAIVTVDRSYIPLTGHK